MKLIITNIKEFEQFFDCPNRENFSSNEIHKFSFHQLQKSISVNNSIPLMILQNIDLDGWKDVELRLKGFNDGLCFYEFIGVVS